MVQKPSQTKQTAQPKNAKTQLPTGALWRPVTEEEKKQIKQESKSLLNEFASKLKSIKASGAHHENNSGSRPEGSGWQTDEEFKSTTFANAPFVEDNFLVAEKGAWKK